MAEDRRYPCARFDLRHFLPLASLRHWNRKLQSTCLDCTVPGGKELICSISEPVQTDRRMAVGSASLKDHAK